MIQEIERKVVSMTAASKETIENETGIISSFDKKDMREYLEEAIQEIKRVRNKGSHQI
jgi:hypothetical protein